MFYALPVLVELHVKVEMLSFFFFCMLFNNDMSHAALCIIQNICFLWLVDSPLHVCVCVYSMRDESSRVYENVGLMQQQKSHR